MDIRGLGENIIERLYELNYLKTIPDIYSLHKKRDELITLGGLGEKSIDRILQSIEKSKTQSPARFLYALGIELIGEKTAEDLIAATGSLPKLRSLTYEALLELPQTGAETAKSLLQAFESKLFQQELESLQKMGVMGTVAEIGSAKSSLSNALEGKTFVITGTLSKPRDYFRDLLKSHGATVTDSVSKNTHFLLAGENAGSKMQKAEKLGVHVVSESELETLLKN
jgi:DNA ligase (NAD+)